MRPEAARGEGPGLTDETDADLLVYMAMADEDPDSARAAWEAFYLRHVEYLYRVCLRAYGDVLGGEAGAADIVAETLRFDPGLISPAELIARITAEHEITDLFVENPPIEEIIARLHGDGPVSAVDLPAVVSEVLHLRRAAGVRDVLSGAGDPRPRGPGRRQRAMVPVLGPADRGGVPPDRPACLEVRRATLPLDGVVRRTSAQMSSRNIL